MRYIKREHLETFQYNLEDIYNSFFIHDDYNKFLSASAAMQTEDAKIIVVYLYREIHSNWMKWLLDLDAFIINLISIRMDGKTIEYLEEIRKNESIRNNFNLLYTQFKSSEQLASERLEKNNKDARLTKWEKWIVGISIVMLSGLFLISGYNIFKFLFPPVHYSAPQVIQIPEVGNISVVYAYTPIVKSGKGEVMIGFDAIPPDLQNSALVLTIDNANRRSYFLQWEKNTFTYDKLGKSNAVMPFHIESAGQYPPTLDLILHIQSAQSEASKPFSLALSHLSTPGIYWILPFLAFVGFFMVNIWRKRRISERLTPSSLLNNFNPADSGQSAQNQPKKARVVGDMVRENLAEEIQQKSDELGLLLEELLSASGNSTLAEFNLRKKMHQINRTMANHESAFLKELEGLELISKKDQTWLSKNLFTTRSVNKSLKERRDNKRKALNFLKKYGHTIDQFAPNGELTKKLKDSLDYAETITFLIESNDKRAVHDCLNKSQIREAFYILRKIDLPEEDHTQVTVLSAQYTRLMAKNTLLNEEEKSREFNRIIESIKFLLH